MAEAMAQATAYKRKSFLDMLAEKLGTDRSGVRRRIMRLALDVARELRQKYVGAEKAGAAWYIILSAVMKHLWSYIKRTGNLPTKEELMRMVETARYTYVDPKTMSPVSGATLEQVVKAYIGLGRKEYSMIKSQKKFVIKI